MREAGEPVFETSCFRRGKGGIYDCGDTNVENVGREIHAYVWQNAIIGGGGCGYIAAFRRFRHTYIVVYTEDPWVL